MTQKSNCLPIPTAPVQFFPDAPPCPDCNETTCNCAVSDLIFDVDVTQCMANLNISRGQQLAQVIVNLSAAICALQNPTCLDISMPYNYPNIGFVGSESSCTYAVSGLTFPASYEVVIDSIFHDLGSQINSAALIASLDNLGLGVWNLVGSVLTAVGYHTYGELSKNGSSFASPTCATDGNTKDLCDFASAIDEKVADIEAELYSLQGQISGIGQPINVIYANAVPVTLVNATGNLHGFTVPAGTLLNDGDTLVVDFSIQAVVNAGGGQIVKLYIQNTSNFINLFLPDSTTGVSGSYKLIRISDTSVLFYGSYQMGSYGSPSTGGYEILTNAVIINPPFANGSPWNVTSLTTNSMVMQLDCTTINGGTLKSNFLTVEKLLA